MAPKNVKAAGESRHRGDISIKRVLVAVDGSDNSTRAARMDLTIAEKYESELVVLNVIPGRAYDRFKSLAEKKAREIAERGASIARDHGIKARPKVLPSEESIVGRIVEYASDEKVDLIVIGTRGLGCFKRMLIGSVSSGVVTHAPCPVLVVR